MDHSISLLRLKILWAKVV